MEKLSDLTSISGAERVSRERDILAAVLDLAGVLVVVLDMQGRIVYFNAACERLTGFAADEIEGLRLWDQLLPEEDVSGVRQVFSELTAGQFPNQHENWWLTKDGDRCRIKWTNSCLLDDRGHVRYVIGTGIDVSDRRAMEDALVESDERAQAILDTAVDAVITIDAEGRIEVFNKAAERIFGYRADEIKGSNVSVLMPSPFVEGHDEYLQRYMETGQRRIIGIGREVVGRRKDGSTFPMELSVGEAWLPDKRVFTGIARDITERKEAERVAKRRLSELAHTARVAAMGNLASGLAHEVNQPLTAIVSHADGLKRMLAAGHADHETLYNALQRISEQGRRAADIIRHLRQFVRKDDDEYTHFDVNAMVLEVIRLLHHELETHDIELVLELEDPLPELYADKVQIEQVLVNLIRNAIQAMNEATERVLTIETDVDESSVLIRVDDTGPGFDTEQAERLFEPFYTTKPEGLGQGLAICRSIVETHEGRIWADQKETAGCVFSVSLPGQVSGHG